MQVYRVEKIRCGYDQTEAGEEQSSPLTFFWVPAFSKKFGSLDGQIYRIVKSASGHVRKRDILSWASAVMQVIELHLRHLQRYIIFSNAYQGSQLERGSITEIPKIKVCN